MNRALRRRRSATPGRALGALALACAVAVSGCSSDEGQQGDSSGASAAQAENAPSGRISVPAPQVAVLGAGETGGATLDAGSWGTGSASGLVRREDRIRQSVSGREPEDVSPPWRSLTFESSVEEASEGRLRQTLRVTGADSAQEQTAAALQSASGFRMDMTMPAASGGAGASSDSSRDATAGTIAVDLTAPAGASDTSKTAMEESLVPLVSWAVALPTEPVGVGGRWSVTQPPFDYAQYRQVTTYRVVALDGDTVTLAARMEFTPSTSDLDAGGTTLRTQSSTLTGTASTLVLRKGSLLPSKGTFDLTGKTTYAPKNDSGAQGSAGSPATVTQETRTTIRFGAAPR